MLAGAASGIAGASGSGVVLDLSASAGGTSLSAAPAASMAVSGRQAVTVPAGQVAGVTFTHGLAPTAGVFVHAKRRWYPSSSSLSKQETPRKKSGTNGIVAEG